MSHNIMGPHGLLEEELFFVSLCRNINKERVEERTSARTVKSARYEHMDSDIQSHVTGAHFYDVVARVLS
jgi:hypothetical protein